MYKICARSNIPTMTPDPSKPALAKGVTSWARRLARDFAEDPDTNILLAASLRLANVALSSTCTTYASCASQLQIK